MKKRKYGFGVSKDDSGAYNHVRIKFCKKIRGSFEWVGYIDYQQAKGKNRFYAPSVRLFSGKFREVKAMNYIVEDLKEAGFKINNYSSSALEDILEYVKENYHRYVYDKRVNDIVRIDRVKDINLYRFLAKKENNHTFVSVLAYNQEEAKEKLIKKIKEELKHNPYNKKELEEWLKNKRIEADNINTAPCIDSAEKILGLQGGE